MTHPVAALPDPLDVPLTRRDVLAVLAAMAADEPPGLIWERLTLAWRGHATSEIGVTP